MLIRDLNNIGEDKVNEYNLEHTSPLPILRGFVHDVGQPKSSDLNSKTRHMIDQSSAFNSGDAQQNTFENTKELTSLV